MRYLLSGLLILAAAAALVTAGCQTMAQSPTGNTGESSSGLGTRCGVENGDSPSERPARGTVPVYADKSPRGDVPEVVVAAGRPGWLMPEVVVSANRMPEVVVHASWSPAPVAAAIPQASFVN